MAAPTKRLMTRSNLALAKQALAPAQEVMPSYSHRNSPKKFTRPQLPAILTVREMLHLDHRGTEDLLKDWSDLRGGLALKAMPDYATLRRARGRLPRKGPSRTCSATLSPSPAGGA
jgi:hypothetical protein